MKTLLITHNDMDGVVCAILGGMAWGADLDVSYCRTPPEATERLKKVLSENEIDKFNQIVVSDLSFLLNEIQPLPDSDVLLEKVMVFDHHQTAFGSLPNWTRGKIAVKREDGVLTCGTELLHNYLVEQRLIEPRPRFVEFVRSYDTWDWSKSNDKTPYLLNSLLYTFGQQYFIDEYSKRLKDTDLDEDNLFSATESVVLQVKESEKEREISWLVSQTRVVEAGDYKFGFVSVIGSDVSTLGKRICDEREVDIAFMFNLNTGKVSVRSSRSDINLGILMRKYFGDGAGGHAAAAGTMIDFSYIDPFILKLFAPFGFVRTIEPKNS